MSQPIVNNPILAEVTRGGVVESRHTGAFCVSDAPGNVVASAGDIETPFFPRSAIKAIQFLAAIEAGVLERFAFSDEEVALACSSHGGEPDHVRVARAMLTRIGAGEDEYECGAHWPSLESARLAAIRAMGKPLQVHNNCSGKHAGMLALARVLGVAPTNYTDISHPVQKHIAATLGRLCDVDAAKLPVGVDGCSVPNWAIPLKNLALGFARLPAAAPRIIDAVKAHPFMVAGTGRFDTRLIQAVPRIFLKTGAEGVFCGCVPHAGLGFALKCDDGASRAAQVSTAKLLRDLKVWTPEEDAALAFFTHEDQKNWRKILTGEVRAS